MHLLTGKKPGQTPVVTGVTTGPAVALPPLPHSLIIQTGVPENRTKILLRLKDVARSLTPYAHQLPTGMQGLTEQIPEAYELCNLIEVCLLHGIRIREFHGVVPLWGLLERLDALYMTHPTPTSTSSNSSATSSSSSSSSSGSGSSKSLVSMVSSLSRLRSPLAKARGWIRLVLNRRFVDEVISHVSLSLSFCPGLHSLSSLLSLYPCPLTTYGHLPSPHAVSTPSISTTIHIPLSLRS